MSKWEELQGKLSDISTESGLNKKAKKLLREKAIENWQIKYDGELTDDEDIILQIIRFY
ncbi:hypothetical protein [Priestia flexa]|uniref:hypothetical protein n=1 Tax=Priestia flexa TaxID=86664 RepID=UPI0032EB310B